MWELSWKHQSGGVDPGRAARSGPKTRKLDRTPRIVAVILWCTIVVLLAIALAITSEPLRAVSSAGTTSDADAGSLQMLAGDSFLAALSARAGTIHVDACDPGPGEYNTLAGARTEASPGDTIVIHGGSYPETLDIDKALTITASDGPALVGEYYVASRPVSVPVTVCPDCWEVLPFDANAKVYYPSDSPGGTPIACGGPFPAVVYAHGSRDGDWPTCNGSDPGDISQDYLQADGILTRLAASGIIAISVDVSHYPLSRTGIVINTIAYLRDANEASGSWLEDAVALERVGLSGHSMGGDTAILAALLYDAPAYDELDLGHVQIQGLGLVAPADWSLAVDVPMLVIHGTKEPPCQVGIGPVEIYSRASTSKHLVVVDGANHFGYTDDICLEPADPLCPDDDDAPGWDSNSAVGGVEGQDAHARQRRTARNYVHAFFSRYLQGNDDALDHLTGEQCELPGGDPPDWVGAASQPVRPFDDLEDLNVQVWVFSCLE